MKDVIRGKAFVLGDNIDTDQIIPAGYLTLDPSVPDERKRFGRFALSGVPDAQSGLPDGHLPFVDLEPKANTKSQYTLVIAGNNFGCGSSREHAPLALAEAGVRAVVAGSYARIFFRNSVNGGYLLPCETAENLPDHIKTGHEVELNLDDNLLRDLTTGKTFSLRPIGDARTIIEAGGLFGHAKREGII